MKYRDIIAKLRAAGLTIVEGARHTKVYKDGAFVSTVPRHREVKRPTVRQIERDTGVSLL